VTETRVAEFQATVKLLCAAPPVEIRIITLAGKLLFRRFNSSRAAAAWADEQEEQARGIYVVMNPFAEAAIANATVNDAAVTRRRWLLIDLDPVRPKDANATDAELDAATKRAAKVSEDLTALGWPLPVSAISGNGAHLLYRLDEPNDAATTELTENVLAALAEKYTDEQVELDTTVSNASRITKLYGTLTRKGATTEERPWRPSMIVNVPAPLGVVERPLLEALTASRQKPAPAPPAATKLFGDRSIYDLGQVLARLEVIRTFTKGGSTFHVVRCPWAWEHSTARDDEATVVTVGGATGGLGFTCLHAHCRGRDWTTLRDHLGIQTRGWQERQKREATPQRPPDRDQIQATPQAAKKPKLRRLADGGKGAIESLDRFHAGDFSDRVPTGITKLDSVLYGGWRKHELYLIGAPSGGGKTSIVECFAMAAAKARGAVLLASPEMSLAELAERDLIRRAATPRRDRSPWPLDLETGAMRERRREEALTAHAAAYVVQQAEALPIFILDDLEATMPDVVEAARALKADGGLALLIVDYVQQLADMDPKMPRYLSVGNVALCCMGLARELDVPVLLTSQVNVTEQKKGEKAYTYRESEILQHKSPNALIFEVTYSDTKMVLSAVLRFQKHRAGPRAEVPVLYDNALYSISDADEGYGPEVSR
jgi:replicative DNA helicase